MLDSTRCKRPKISALIRSINTSKVIKSIFHYQSLFVNQEIVTIISFFIQQRWEHVVPPGVPLWATGRDHRGFGFQRETRRRKRDKEGSWKGRVCVGGDEEDEGGDLFVQGRRRGGILVPLSAVWSHVRPLFFTLLVPIMLWVQPVYTHTHTQHWGEVVTAVGCVPALCILPAD